MEKGDLNNIPVIRLPDGYVLRNFSEGDEAGLSRVYTACGLGCDTPEAVRERIVRHPCFRPERVFIIERSGEIVGTAAAWLEGDDPGLGYLHMVGVLPEHRGKRLGAILSVAAIGHTMSEGFSRQRLKTDEWREAAVCLYLDLGFYPLISDETQPPRWEELARRLHRPDIIAHAKRLG